MDKEKIFYSKLKNNIIGKNKFIKRFKKYMESIDEFIAEPIEDDYIIRVFEHQGYYSGVQYRISYDIKNNKFYATPRMFGV